MQDTATLERFGVSSRAGELAIMDAALWEVLWGSGTLGLRLRAPVEYIAEIFGRHGVEMGFEDFRPTGSICLRFEVKFQSLKAVMVIDAVSEEVFLAWFTPTDEIHFVKVMQVGCYKASLCQSMT